MLNWTFLSPSESPWEDFDIAVYALDRKKWQIWYRHEILHYIFWNDFTWSKLFILMCWCQVVPEKVGQLPNHTSHPSLGLAPPSPQIDIILTHDKSNELSFEEGSSLEAEIWAFESCSISLLTKSIFSYTSVKFPSPAQPCALQSLHKTNTQTQN